MIKCPYCQEDVQEEAIKCKHCGEILAKNEYARARHESSGTAEQYWSSIGECPARLRTYYTKQFAKFDRNNGKFVFTWNWGAFLLSFVLFPVWYFLKGMWLKGAIYLAACVPFVALVFPLPFYFIYIGLFANYDYYLFIVKRKKLW